MSSGGEPAAAGFGSPDRRHRTLLEINNAVVTSRTGDELFRAACEALARVFSFDQAGLTAADPDTREPRLFAFEGRHGGSFYVVGQSVESRDRETGALLDYTKPLLRRDLETERRFEHEHAAYADGIRSYCAVPLFFQGRCVGSFGISSRTPGRYDAHDLDLLGEVARQLALAVANVQAYEQIAALKARLEAENRYLQEEIREEHNFDEIVGRSSALREALHAAGQVAPSGATALILGETGTGKELVARAIHRRSPRAGRPLVKVNCAALSAGLVESELFGHVKGAFTGATSARSGRFALADGGTLFLDEVGELPLETQVKLLRVLQEGEFEPVGSSDTARVDVRLIAATNRDLEAAVRSGRFRPDLFYRLSVFPIRVPPLRERPDDVPLLATFFLERFARRSGKRLRSLDAGALEALGRYAWPGNVRELQNVMERSVVLAAPARTVLSLDLLPDLRAEEPATPLPAGAPPPRPAAAASPQTLEALQRRHIEDVLERTGGRIEGPGGAAALLRLRPSTLRSRMRKLGIRRD